MSLQVDRLAVRARAERLVREVDQHRAGERVGDDEGRRGEVVRPHVRVHAALEVAVAREHRDGHEVVVVDRLRDVSGQRPGIADAGGAAEADEVEAERVEIAPAGRPSRSTPRRSASRARARSSPTASILRPFATALRASRPGADHHARVRGVGAGGDRRDHHVAVAEVEIRALDLARAGRARRPCGTPSPWRPGTRSWRCRAVTRSCGRLGPASEGCTSARSSSSVSVKTGSGVSAVRHMPCALA